MGLYVPRPPSHMKWGSRGLNWWAGKGQTPWNPYLEATGRKRQVQARSTPAMSPPPTPLDCQAEESKAEFILRLKFSFPFIRSFVPI